MSILVTCPGKFGDILWSMATARAISETYGETVDVWLSEQYGSIAPLLEQQPYIRSVFADPQWQVLDTAPMTPRIPPNLKVTHDRVFHLGYEGWPEVPLPYEHWRLAAQQRAWFAKDLPLRDVELGRPWISTSVHDWDTDVAVGFTEEWIELKMGLLIAVGARSQKRGLIFRRLFSDGSTRHREWPYLEEFYIFTHACDWTEAAHIIHGASVFLGCNSALHVLAVALGVPVVLMEPNPMRHHPIFYPLGDTGPQVTLVRGNDGQPTFDARHVAQTLEAVLQDVKEGSRV